MEVNPSRDADSICLVVYLLSLITWKTNLQILPLKEAWTRNEFVLMKMVAD